MNVVQREIGLRQWEQAPQARELVFHLLQTRREQTVKLLETCPMEDVMELRGKIRMLDELTQEMNQWKL